MSTAPSPPQSEPASPVPSPTPPLSTPAEGIVSKEWLLRELRADPSRLMLLDCRTSHDFGESHIRHAVNFSIPTIMLRRLGAGKIDLLATVNCRQLKARLDRAYKQCVFVVYGEPQMQQQGDTVAVVTRRLKQDGCRTVCLEGGFAEFHAAYPEWCDSCSELLALTPPPQDAAAAAAVAAAAAAAASVPLMGLRSLRISTPLQRPHRPATTLGSSCGNSAGTSSTDSSSDSEERCDSSLGLEDDRDFLVEILPHLFLGNAANSEDSEALSRNHIQYILNVTADLPNVFEGSGAIQYMQIPIADHWSQNLARFFPKAIEFIDEARSNQKGVLVHCLAGVSRSVTITVAYLMYKMNLSLNDAFNLVRSRKANVAPNFHFMEQLYNFERELRAAPGRGLSSLEGSVDSGDPGSASLSPPPGSITTPDSGLIYRLSSPSDSFCSDGSPAPDGGRPPGDNSTGDTPSQPRTCSGCGCSVTVCKCSVLPNFLSPLAFGQSPDSGIEFDRWASNSTPGGD